MDCRRRNGGGEGELSKLGGEVEWCFCSRYCYWRLEHSPPPPGGEGGARTLVIQEGVLNLYCVQFAVASVMIQFWL